MPRGNRHQRPKQGKKKTNRRIAKDEKKIKAVNKRVTALTHRHRRDMRHRRPRQHHRVMNRDSRRMKYKLCGEVRGIGSEDPELNQIFMQPVYPYIRETRGLKDGTTPFTTELTRWKKYRFHSVRITAQKMHSNTVGGFTAVLYFSPESDNPLDNIDLSTLLNLKCVKEAEPGKSVTLNVPNRVLSKLGSAGWMHVQEDRHDPALVMYGFTGLVVKGRPSVGLNNSDYTAPLYRIDIDIDVEFQDYNPNVYKSFISSSSALQEKVSITSGTTSGTLVTVKNPKLFDDFDPENAAHQKALSSYYDLHELTKLSGFRKTIFTLCCDAGESIAQTLGFPFSYLLNGAVAVARIIEDNTSNAEEVLKFSLHDSITNAADNVPVIIPNPGIADKKIGLDIQVIGGAYKNDMLYNAPAPDAHAISWKLIKPKIGFKQYNYSWGGVALRLADKDGEFASACEVETTFLDASDRTVYKETTTLETGKQFMNLFHEYESDVGEYFLQSQGQETPITGPRPPLVGNIKFEDAKNKHGFWNLAIECVTKTGSGTWLYAFNNCDYSVPPTTVDVLPEDAICLEVILSYNGKNGFAPRGKIAAAA